MVLILIPVVLIGVLLILFTGGILTQRVVRTPSFRDAQGEVVEHSIAEFYRVPINGDTHSVLIRGENLDNPVMLFLHAGPCLSETGLMRNFHAQLEKHYTMAYYDMRGSGKSYNFFQRYSFSTEQLLQDIHEMTAFLKDKLDTDKIGLLGHSFGAGFGALAANTYPDDYSIFIGIGQPSNINEQNRVTYKWVVDIATNDQNSEALKELAEVNNYWESTEAEEYFPGMMIHKKWVAFYGGQIVGERDFIPFVLRNLRSGEYNFFDYLPFYLGMNAGGPASFDIMISTNLKEQAADFQCPVIFITGRQDFNLGPAVAEDYFNSIDAPMKAMYWFEDSAHFPHFEEAGLFQSIMIDEILPLLEQ